MKRFIGPVFFALLLSCLGPFATLLPAQSIFTSMQQEDTIQLIIETDLKALLRNDRTKAPDPPYQEAVLRYTSADGQHHVRQIEVRPRGNMRREICSLPPLKIRFAKAELKAENLQPYRTLKLVERCHAPDWYNEFVLEEYLTYKLYNVITEESFRVQLADIRVVDSRGKGSDIQSYGFIIEPEDELAARLAGKPLEPRIVSPKALDTATFDRMALFQFMIGNTDWHVYNLHNLTLLALDKYRLPVAVPYDFDYCGLINTPYAAPHENKPIRSVRERYYMGMCRPEPRYQEVVDDFLNKEAQLFALVDGMPYLSPAYRQRYREYLESFFEIVRDPKFVKQHIERSCDSCLADSR